MKKLLYLSEAFYHSATSVSVCVEVMVMVAPQPILFYFFLLMELSLHSCESAGFLSRKQLSGAEAATHVTQCDRLLDGSRGNTTRTGWFGRRSTNVFQIWKNPDLIVIFHQDESLVPDVVLRPVGPALRHRKVRPEKLQSEIVLAQCSRTNQRPFEEIEAGVGARI